MYSQAVEKAFEHPAHAGRLSGACGAAGSRESGTEVVFRMQVENGRISQMCFQAYGCPHTIAACELAVEGLLGQLPGALGSWDPGTAAEWLDIPVEKTGKLLLIQDALRNCLQDWDTTELGVTE